MPFWACNSHSTPVHYTQSACCSKVFDTDEAQADLRFVELLDGENKILVVTAVAPGSKAEKVCVKADHLS